MTTPDINASTHTSSVAQAVRRTWQRLNVRVGMAAVKASVDGTNPRCATLDRHQTSVQAVTQQGMRIFQAGRTTRRSAMPTVRPRSLAPSFDEPRHDADNHDGKNDRHPHAAVAAHPVASAPHAAVHHGVALGEREALTQ